MDSRTVVGIGGFPDEPLLEYVVGPARGRRLLYVPTASSENRRSTADWYEHLHFFPVAAASRPTAPG